MRAERLKTVLVHRSAVTGRFVTPSKAKRSPKTTVAQRVPKPKRGK